MGFDDFFGNRTIVDVLRGMLARDRLPHALLFAGPSGIGKYTLAQMLAKAVHCESDAYLGRQDFCGICLGCKTIALADDRRQAIAEAEAEREKISKRPREIPLLIQHHPDVLLLAPNGPLRLFQIEQARHLKQALEFVPAGNRKRVYILPDADRMDRAAANSLLKSLEEPPPHALLILTTANEAALLPTIRSRCVPLWFSPLNNESVAMFLEQRGCGRDAAERALRAAVAKGSPGAGLRLDLEHHLRLRESLLAILSAAIDQQDFATFFSQSQRITGGDETLENLLPILYSLLQDILHIEAKADGEPLRNADRPRMLRQLARQMGVPGVMHAAAALERLERNLRRNIPTRLSLEAFAMGLAKVRRMS
jgi:DNA polymerase-3 subunit delta'